MRPNSLFQNKHTPTILHRDTDLFERSLTLQNRDNNFMQLCSQSEKERTLTSTLETSKVFLMKYISEILAFGGISKIAVVH